MAGPMRPDEVVSRKAAQLPEAVFEVFNALITKAWDGRQAVLRQDDVIDALIKRDPDLDRQTIYDQHMLDVEPVYRDAGWKVLYDKPGFNESYRPSFVFSKPGDGPQKQ